MTAEALSPAASLLAASRAMLRAAQHGDWDEVRQLESSRRDNLASLLSEANEDTLGVESLSQTLREIQALTDEVAVLASHEREQIRREIVQLQNAARAGAAYGKAQEDPD